MRYVPKLRWTVALLAAWACVILAAGHGVAPLGAVLVFGFREWRSPAIVGWTGLLLVLGAHWRGGRVMYASGLALLALAWGIALGQVDVPAVTLLTSPLFLVLFGYQLRLVVVGQTRAGDSAA